MNFETMPEPNKGKESPPPEIFGENVFEIDPQTGALKKISPEVEKPKEKKETPADVREAAEKFALEESWNARDPQEADRLKKEAYEKYLKEHGY